MNKLMSVIGLAGVLTLASANTIAGDRHHQDERQYFGTNVEKARVVDVDPIYRYVRVSSPDRECWSEPHRYNNRQQSYTSTIAGGIIGGVIGNQFGGGSGKTIMTVAGTLLGGSIGRDMQGTHPSHYQETRYEQHCQVTDRHHKERVLDGYNVTYKYHGKLYSTYMNRHPGKFINVDVDVRPSSYKKHHEREYY